MLFKKQKRTKLQNTWSKFFSPFLKTLGVCTCAYLILCLLNAYAPEKDDGYYKVPLKERTDYI